MTTVSLGALGFLAELLREVEAPPEVAIRLIHQRRESRLALRLDYPRAEDVCWYQRERTVLAVSPEAHMEMRCQHLQVRRDWGRERLELVPRRAA